MTCFVNSSKSRQQPNVFRCKYQLRQNTPGVTNLRSPSSFFFCSAKTLRRFSFLLKEKMAPITRRVAAERAQRKRNKSTHRRTTGKTFLEIPKKTMGPLTRSATAKQAQQKNKPTQVSTTGKTLLGMPKGKIGPLNCRATAKPAQQKNSKSTHSSTTVKKCFELPKRTTGPLNRSARAKQAQQKTKSTQSSSTGETLEMLKRSTAPITRSAAAKQTQQKNKKANLGTFITTPIRKNPYREYGLHPRRTKRLVRPTNSKQFHCVFCNEASCFSVKPHPSCAVGYLDCKICKAQYKFRVSAELSCAQDVQAALLAGDSIKWMSATQGPVFESI